MIQREILYMQNFVKENTGQDFTEPQTALYMKGKLKKKNKQKNKQNPS